MTRKSAEHFREIAKKARIEELNILKRQESENKRQLKKDAEDNSRRVGIWKIIYEYALGGELEVGIVNVAPEDLIYFESIGFGIELDSGMPENIEQELSSLYEKQYSLQNKRDEIDGLIFDKEEFDKIDSEIYINKDPLIAWLVACPEVAYACDMEDWFGDGPNTTENIRSRRDLENFLEFAKEKKNRSKDQKRIDRLQELIDSIHDCKSSIENNFNLKNGYRKLERINLALTEISNRMDFIENKTDWDDEWEDGAPNIFSWAGEVNPASSTLMEYYSYRSVKWISSGDGQACLERFEWLVSEFSKKGCTHLLLKIENLDKNISIKNDEMDFDSVFPTLFDLRESLTILGYKVVNPRNSGSSLRVSW
jgi:hypothetical protein